MWRLEKTTTLQLTFGSAFGSLRLLTIGLSYLLELLQCFSLLTARRMESGSAARVGVMRRAAALDY